MKIITGDLISLALAGEFDVIVHGCNCFCVMGAGIAKQMFKTFPEALAVDRQTTKGDRAKFEDEQDIKAEVASNAREAGEFTLESIENDRLMDDFLPFYANSQGYDAACRRWHRGWRH